MHAEKKVSFILLSVLPAGVGSTPCLLKTSFFKAVNTRRILSCLISRSWTGKDFRAAKQPSR